MKNITIYFMLMILPAFMIAAVEAQMTILDKWTVFSCEEPDHVNFAYLAKTNEGKLLMGFNTGVHPYNEIWNSLMSSDYGLSWEPMIPTIGPTSFVDMPYDLPIVSLGTMAWKVPSLTNTMRTWLVYGFYNLEQTRRYQVDITFPFDPNVTVLHRSILYFGDTHELLATAYITRVSGDNYHEAAVLRSIDLGKSWSYLSTAIKKESYMTGSEGANEPIMVRLTNGNLLLVARTGDIGVPDIQTPEDCPMYYAISTDRGASWSAPVSLGTPGVGQDMVVLEDGRVVLSYGRPNVYVRVADPTGTNWGTPITIYEGAGSGYTGMRLDDQGNVLLIYNESDFAVSQTFSNYPGTTNYMKMVKLSVNKPCGGTGYLAGDFNRDCDVDLGDFSLLASQWLD